MLVNNAGLMLLGPVADQTPDDWRRMVGVNLLGPPLLHARRAAADGADTGEGTS